MNWNWEVCSKYIWYKSQLYYIWQQIAENVVCIIVKVKRSLCTGKHLYVSFNIDHLSSLCIGPLFVLNAMNDRYTVYCWSNVQHRICMVPFTAEVTLFQSSFFFDFSLDFGVR